MSSDSSNPPLSRVFVALGSNQGDSCALLSAAIERLQAFSTRPVRSSRFFASSPVDCPPGSPDFVNAVAELQPRPDLTPESLLAELQELERAFGRRPKQVLNEARPLDLDLIAWGDQTRASPTLNLPHPRAHLRRFVLLPLADLAPDLTLPGQAQTVVQLLDALVTTEQLRPLPRLD